MQLHADTSQVRAGENASKCLCTLCALALASKRIHSDTFINCVYTRLEVQRITLRRRKVVPMRFARWDGGWGGVNAPWITRIARLDQARQNFAASIVLRTPPPTYNINGFIIGILITK